MSCISLYQDGKCLLRVTLINPALTCLTLSFKYLCRLKHIVFWTHLEFILSKNSWSAKKTTTSFLWLDDFQVVRRHVFLLLSHFFNHFDAASVLRPTEPKGSFFCVLITSFLNLSFVPLHFCIDLFHIFYLSFLLTFPDAINLRKKKFMIFHSS